ncbi:MULTISPECIES: VOC family protein [unclassified Pseudarthrobacter]|uniref:VOC family protein n=1 Tax=unclassified Pseudarthrobacter TaxID=2647000 RepID=UPI003076F6D0
MNLRIQAVSIDSTDPKVPADFWEKALDWRRTYEAEDEIVLEPPAGSPADGVCPDLLFLKVPERKELKNRLHLDLRPEDQAEEVKRLEALGAVRVDVGQGPEVTWVVMADPDGNEFCVLRALKSDELEAQGLVPGIEGQAVDGVTVERPAN